MNEPLNHDTMKLLQRSINDLEAIKEISCSSLSRPAGVCFHGSVHVCIQHANPTPPTHPRGGLLAPPAARLCLADFCCHGNCILSFSHKLDWTGLEGRWSERVMSGSQRSTLNQRATQMDSGLRGTGVRGEGWGGVAISLLLVCKEIYEPPLIPVKLEYTAEETGQCLVYEPC